MITILECDILFPPNYRIEKISLWGLIQLPSATATTNMKLNTKLKQSQIFLLRLLFWTDWGSPPKIERASLAGLHRTVLVDLSGSNQNWPNVIFVDYTEDRIYWIDAWIDAIDSTDLNGNNRRQITNPIRPSYNMHPFDFTVYDDVLYWSDWNTYSIEKLNWTTGAYLGRFDIVTPGFVFGVALLHQSRQPASAGKQK